MVETSDAAATNQSTAAVAPAVSTTTTSSSSSSSGSIDVSDLISRCGFDASSLLSLSVCPALESYREVIGVSESSIGAFDPMDFSSYFPHTPHLTDSTNTTTDSHSTLGGRNSNTRLSNQPNQDSALDYPESYHSSSAYDDDDNDYDNEEAEFGDDSYGTMTSPSKPSSARKSTAGIALNRRSSLGSMGKIHWDDVGTSESDGFEGSSGVLGTPRGTPGKESKGDNGSAGGGGKASNAVVWDAAGISCSNDYSFFDMDKVNKSNSWAGARHWKYANRRQLPDKPSVVEAEGDEEGVASKGVVESGVDEKGSRDWKQGNAVMGAKGVKEAFSFDFTSEWPAEELFAVSKKTRGDVTCLTAAALEKEALFEEEGGLFLPPDAKLQTIDLCRLMLSRNIIVPPPALAHVLMKQAASSSSKGKSADVIWGQVRKIPTNSTTFQPNLDYNVADDYDDDDNEGGFGEDFCDPESDEPQVDIAEGITEILRDGLYIGGEGLLKASRTVDKIDIG